MASNIYRHINQEMHFFELCLDMAKKHVEDVLLTLAIIDDQSIPLCDRDAVNKEYLQELNQQLGKIFTELDSWRCLEQTTNQENGPAA